MFSLCSHARMIRLDDDVLELHLEVALSGAPAPLLDGLTDIDRRRRHAAVADLARHLTKRLRGVEASPVDGAAMVSRQPSLFPADLLEPVEHAGEGLAVDALST